MLEWVAETKSQLAEGLEAYLRAFVDLSAWKNESKAFLFSPEWMGGLGEEERQAAVIGLYQSPEVVNRKHLEGDKDTERIRKELDARGEFLRGPGASSTSPWTTEREASGWIVVL